MPKLIHESKRCRFNVKTIRNAIWVFITITSVAYIVTLLIIHKNSPAISENEITASGGKNTFLRPKDREKGELPSSSEGTKKLLLPVPIVLAGLPKAGSTSIADFFRCNGLRVSHNICRPEKLGNRGLCGNIMNKNLKNGKPFFEDTGNWDVYGQIENVDNCFFPMVDHLEKIHEDHFNATIILNLRDVDEWIDSTVRWTTHNDLPMSTRLAKCNYRPELLTSGSNGDDADILVPNVILTDEIVHKKLKALFLGQAEQVRQFVKKYPSHKLVEVYIDRDDAGDILGRNFFGVPDGEENENCWKHHNKNIWNRPGEKIKSHEEIQSYLLELRRKQRERKRKKNMKKQEGEIV